LCRFVIAGRENLNYFSGLPTNVPS
jgi:hypothetical protein